MTKPRKKLRLFCRLLGILVPKAIIIYIQFYFVFFLYYVLALNSRYTYIAC